MRICGQEQPSLPQVPGGWRRDCVDVGWTTVTLAVPASPDALLEAAVAEETDNKEQSAPYWARLWPSAEQMARLLPRADWPAGTDVLEVGCGLGLVGIAGLKRGWRVELTDKEPAALEAARQNAALNGFPDAAVSPLDWRDPPLRKRSVILACDVLYEAEHHKPLLDLIETLLADCGCCWIGDPGRTPLIEFYQSACERGFRITLRDSRGRKCAYPVRTQFQLLEVRRGSEG